MERSRLWVKVGSWLGSGEGQGQGVKGGGHGWGLGVRVRGQLGLVGVLR